MKRAIRILAGTIPVVVFLAGSEALAGVTPVLTASRCTTDAEVCAAPLAVFFSARGTTCTTGECDNQPIENEAFHALSYQWSFGDSGSGTWAASGQSRNVEYGPLAIHVFDRPGTYNVQLTVRSNTEALPRTVTVYVDDPNTVWSGKTRCISSSGNFTGCPSGATQVTSSSYGSATATALAAGDRRILFRGGETFALDATPSLPNGPGMIGSYGSGKARINGVGGAQDFVRQGSSVADWRFVDLEVLQAVSGTSWVNNLIQREGSGGSVTTNFLWYKIKRLTGDTAILDVHETTGSYGSPGTFIVESEIGSGGTANTFFFSTVGGGMIGNKLGSPAGNVNHLYRIQPRFRELLIAHNEFACCAESDMTIRGHVNGVSDFAVLRQNLVRSGSNTHGWSIWPEYNEKDARMRDIIIENNRLESGNEMTIAARSVTVRNNLLFNSNIEPTTAHGCSLPAGWVSDIMIYNNSGYGGRSLVDVVTWQCAQVMGTRHTLRNNLHWNPTAGPTIIQSGVSGTVLSNNLTRNDVQLTPFRVSPPSIQDPTTWRLEGPGASAAINSGFNLGSTVKIDFEHALRPSGAGIDIGAMESGAVGPPPPPPPGPLPPPVLLE
jgi:PKD repeat protein